MLQLDQHPIVDFFASDRDLQVLHTSMFESGINRYWNFRSPFVMGRVRLSEESQE